MHCQHGSLKLTAEKLETSWRDGRQEIFPAQLEKNSAANPSTTKHIWHQAIIKDFLDAVRDGHEPMVTGRSALASHRLIDAIEKSSKTAAAIDLTVEGK